MLILDRSEFDLDGDGRWLDSLSRILVGISLHQHFFYSTTIENSMELLERWVVTVWWVSEILIDLVDSGSQPETRVVVNGEKIG